jgi:hypothetical protein
MTRIIDREKAIEVRPRLARRDLHLPVRGKHQRA